MRPGRRTHGRPPAQPTTGPACRSMPQRGILYAPTGSAVMDFYGGDRVGNDLYANYATRTRRRNRETAVAFSGSASRHLGSRFSFAAGAVYRPARRQAHRRTGADAPSRVTSTSSTASPASRSFPSTSIRIRRAPFQARSRRRRSPCPMAGALSQRQQLTEDMLTNAHSGGACVGREDVSRVPQRRAVLSLRRRQADCRLSRIRRRRRVGRAGNRPGLERALRECRTRWRGSAA